MPQRLTLSGRSPPESQGINYRPVFEHVEEFTHNDIWITKNYFRSSFQSVGRDLSVLLKEQDHKKHPYCSAAFLTIYHGYAPGAHNHFGVQGQLYYGEQT